MKFVLAPLAGFTNAAFRRLCAQNGADLTYTEMVSAAGLAHGSSPTRHLMATLPGEGPVACQVFGAKPEELAFAAHEAEATGRFVAINLNAGCPMTKVTREGAGAALLTSPEKVYAALAAMKRAVQLPITLKTRPGPKPDCVLLFELLAAAESAGAAGFTLHARFTSQMHGGPVHLDLLAEAVSRAKIPITGNGSVVDAASCRAMTQTGVAAIMIGRAALANPAIFNHLRPSPSTSTSTFNLNLQPQPSPHLHLFRAHVAGLIELREQLLRDFPNDHIPSEDGWLSVALHTHLFRYFNGCPGAAKLRQRLNQIRTAAEVRALGNLPLPNR